MDSFFKRFDIPYPPQKMVIIGFIRIFYWNTPMDSFFKRFDIPYPSPENGDNWIYSVFYVFTHRRIRFSKDLIFLILPRKW